MKAVILVLSPEECYNLFNGNLSVLVRKKFSKDYVGWVYIYCTKGNKNECLIPDLQPDKVYHPLTEKLHRGVYSFVEEKAVWKDCKKYILNGKVVARFWCDKVEEIEYENAYFYKSEENNFTHLNKKACLNIGDLHKYLKGKNGYAIHITKLEIFDKPKEISEFRKLNTVSLEQLRKFGLPYTEEMYKDMAKKDKWFLTRAPQSYCFIEI